jgi:hypothetical protein
MGFYSGVVQVKIDINISILNVLRLKAPLNQAFKAKVAFETIKEQQTIWVHQWTSEPNVQEEEDSQDWSLRLPDRQRKCDKIATRCHWTV